MCIELLHEDDLNWVKTVESEIQSHFPSFVTSLKEKRLCDICIPTQYDVITIDLKTMDDKPLLVEHLIDGVQCIVTVRPSTVVCTFESTFCTWICTQLIANVKYT